MDQVTNHQANSQQGDGDSNIRAQAAMHWQQTRAWAVRIPVSARVVFGVFLLAAFLMALHSTFSGPEASLRLKVQHNLRSADLSVWVNDDLAYSGKLVGSARKRFGLIPDVQGSMSETIPVSSGRKQVRVRVVSDDGSVQEDTANVDFARNAQQTLSVVARHDDLSLDWRHPETAVSETSSSSPGPSDSRWFSRYGGSLLLTVAGSIISALTGYAIKELPKQMASRQSESPKT
jgi:hypothetical protein